MGDTLTSLKWIFQNYKIARDYVFSFLYDVHLPRITELQSDICVVLSFACASLTYSVTQTKLKEKAAAKPFLSGAEHVADFFSGVLTWFRLGYSLYFLFGPWLFWPSEMGTFIFEHPSVLMLGGAVSWPILFDFSRLNRYSDEVRGIPFLFVLASRILAVPAIAAILVIVLQLLLLFNLIWTPRGEWNTFVAQVLSGFGCCSLVLTARKLFKHTRRVSPLDKRGRTWAVLAYVLDIVMKTIAATTAVVIFVELGQFYSGDWLKGLALLTLSFVSAFWLIVDPVARVRGRN